MITIEDLDEAETEGRAAGDYVIDHCSSPFAAALAGAVLVRAFINHQMPDSKQFFLEVIAAEGEDVREVVLRHLKPRAAG